MIFNVHGQITIVSGLGLSSMLLVQSLNYSTKKRGTVKDQRNPSASYQVQAVKHQVFDRAIKNFTIDTVEFTFVSVINAGENIVNFVLCKQIKTEILNKWFCTFYFLFKCTQKKKPNNEKTNCWSSLYNLTEQEIHICMNRCVTILSFTGMYDM